MAQQKDDVGRSGIYPATGPHPENAEPITPGAINEGRTGRRKGIHHDEQIKNAERHPRKGDDIDELSDIPGE
jgi:hypothetical protein